MKRVFSAKLFAFVFVLFVYRISFAQMTSDWQPIYLTVGGSNTVNGVSAFFQINICNGADVVYIKFINQNNYPVKLQWYDAVFTQEKKWVNKENPSEKKSLTLNAGSEVKGECSANNSAEVVVPLKDFIDKAENFKRYTASHFEVLIAEK